MGKHSARDGVSGRFTKSGAPIPDESGQGDTSAYENVDALSGRPGADETARVVYPGIPGEVFGGRGIVRHDVAHGGMQRPIPHRRQVVVDAQSGQKLDARITDVPGADAYASPKTTAHLAAAEGDPLASNLVGPMTGPETRSTRRIPGTDGYRVPSMYDRDHDAEWRGGR